MANQIKTVIHNGIKVPYLGAMVILHLADHDEIQNNGSREMPAVITRVWSKTEPFTVNLKGFPDGTGTLWRTSVMHVNPYPGAVNTQNASWRWPDEELERGVAPMGATE